MKNKKKKENDYWYNEAIKAMESVDPNDKTTLEDLCREVNIDYDSLP